MQNNESTRSETVNESHKQVKIFKNILKHSCIVLCLILYGITVSLFTFQNRFILNESEKFLSFRTKSWFWFSVRIRYSRTNKLRFGVRENNSDVDLFLFQDRTMSTPALNEMISKLTAYNVIHYYNDQYENGAFIKNIKTTLKNIKTVAKFMKRRRKKVVVYGQSFGCYLALRFIKYMPKDSSLILVNPFYLLRSVVKHRFFLPLYLLLVNDYNNYKLIKKLKNGIVLILSENDTYQPKKDIEKIKTLVESKNGEVYTVENSDHFDIWRNNEFYTIINDIFARQWNYPADTYMNTNEFPFTRFFHGKFSIRGNINELNFFD